MAYKYKKYEESDDVRKAREALDLQLGEKPGDYQSQWQQQLDDTLKKIQNRQPFTYNVNGDALYQSYKDKFVRQGQQAMQDTMGQAAGLTGGYGSSYSQNAGQQAYNAYLQNLSDVVPELYEIARSRYDQEGADMLNMYGILSDKEAQDYGRWQDTLSQWQGERDYLSDMYDSLRDYEYSKWADDRDFGYAQYRDEIADKQWERQFAEQQRQYNASLAARNSGGGGEEQTAEEWLRDGVKYGKTAMEARTKSGLQWQLENLAETQGSDAVLKKLKSYAPYMLKSEYDQFINMVTQWFS